MKGLPRAARRLIGAVLPHPGYAGWSMVGLGLLCAALSGPGQSYALTFYLEPLMEAVEISRLEISTLYSVATLAAALAAALALPATGRRAA